jgi:hypothetical protein
MLWHKAWRDTRWRFAIGLVLLLGTALVNVLAYPAVPGILSAALQASQNGPDAADLAAAVQLGRTFRGYVWIQFVHENLLFLWTACAILLGAGRPFWQRNGAIFTLTLPVSRRRLIAVSVATELLELSGLALIPMLSIVRLAPFVGETYAPGDAVVHGLHVFAGGIVFYGLARLLATVLDDRGSPFLITLAVAILLSQCTKFAPMLVPLSPVSVMIGEGYFRAGVPAWTGLLVCLVATALMLYVSMRAIDRRDF